MFRFLETDKNICFNASKLIVTLIRTSLTYLGISRQSLKADYFDAPLFQRKLPHNSKQIAVIKMFSNILVQSVSHDPNTGLVRYSNGEM